MKPVSIPRRSPRAFALALVILASFSGMLPVLTRSVAGLAPGTASREPLDMEGAIRVKDPFAACHADSYDVMAYLGVKMNRKDISWSSIENGADDNWNWASWDHRVEQLRLRNMTVLPILDYSNPAVQQDLQSPSDRVIRSDHDIAEWLEYVNKVVERYHVNDSLAVNDWEIWNEPNLDHFWSGTDEEFFHLQQVTARNLSARYPELNILSSGISGHDPDYIDRMFEAGAMEDVDTIAFHPYSGSNYDTLDLKIQQVMDVGRKHGFNGSYWITEVGMSTPFDPSEPGYEEAYKASLELQASLVPKVYAKALAAGIEVIVWYCLGDFDNWTWGEANFGLVFAPGNVYKPEPYSNDTIKPAGYAYRALAHNLNWTTYVPRGIRFNGGPVSGQNMEMYYFLQDDGDVVLVAWNGNAGDVQLKFTVPAKGVEVFSAPSYKQGEATNYHLANTTSGLEIRLDVGYYPTIMVIDMEDGIDPVTIDVEAPWLGLDFILLIVVPALAFASVVAMGWRVARAWKAAGKNR